MGNVAGDTIITGCAMVSATLPLVPVNGPVPVLLSVAVMEKLKLPDDVGVPDSVPLLASASPAGKVPDASA